MKATQRKKSKMWNSMMKSLREKSKDGKSYYEPAMFTQRYLLTTVLEKNAKGTWHGWKIGHVGPVQNQMLLDGAMGFYDHCLKGDVKVKHEEERQLKPVTPF